MLDIKFVRTNPDAVKENIKKKFQDEKIPMVDEVIEFDAKYRAAKTRCDELRAQRNKKSKEIGGLMAKGQKEEAEKIKAEVKAMADELTARGVKLVSGGTDNHLLLVDLTDSEMTGKELEHNLDEVHITANKNTVPGEKRSPFVTSGVRLGTPAVTTRGMGPAEMKEIADCIADCIFDFEGKKDDIAARVASLTARFPLYE